MSVFRAIQEAMFGKLNDIDGSPSIAWPNTNFTPTEDTAFLQPSLLPTTSNLNALDGTSNYVGILQVDIYVPAEKGTNELNTWIDRVIELYSEEREIYTSYGTVFVQNIDTAALSGGGLGASREEAWYRGIVEVNFFIYK